MTKKEAAALALRNGFEQVQTPLLKRSKKKPDADVINWRSIIDTLSRDVRAIPRGTTLLTARLQQRCPGRTLFRQQVDAWLHPDAAKRNEPKAGMALLLLEEARRLVAETSEKAKESRSK